MKNRVRVHDIGDLKCLIGSTILSVEECCNYEAILRLETSEGILHFDHDQECCESVWLEDGYEDLKDLEGQQILKIEEVEDNNRGGFDDDYYEWTYYKISTFHGDATLRFYGTSNGYYSMGVDVYFEKK